MNWSRVKTILILFFLCTNLFLLGVILISGKRANTISEEIMTSTVEILEKNQIKLDASLIPKRAARLPEVACEPLAEDDEWIFQLLGEQAEKMEDASFQSELGTVSLSDQRFSFSGRIPLENHPEGEQKAILSVLQKCGINRSQVKLQKADAEGKWNLTEWVNEAEIFDQSLELTVSDHAIVQMDGSWFVSLKSQKEIQEQKNAAAILLDFVEMADRPQQESTIVSLELGYAYSEGLYPAWRITLSDGSSYLMDAREK